MKPPVLRSGVTVPVTSDAAPAAPAAPAAAMQPQDAADLADPFTPTGEAGLSDLTGLTGSAARGDDASLLALLVVRSLAPGLVEACGFCSVPGGVRLLKPRLDIIVDPAAARLRTHARPLTGYAERERCSLVVLYGMGGADGSGGSRTMGGMDSMDSMDPIAADAAVLDGLGEPQVLFGLAAWSDPSDNTLWLAPRPDGRGRITHTASSAHLASETCMAVRILPSGVTAVPWPPTGGDDGEHAVNDHASDDHAVPAGTDAPRLIHLDPLATGLGFDMACNRIRSDAALNERIIL